jgi:hypothetical protein
MDRDRWGFVPKKGTREIDQRMGERSGIFEIF